MNTRFWYAYKFLWFVAVSYLAYAFAIVFGYFKLFSFISVSGAIEFAFLPSSFDLFDIIVDFFIGPPYYSTEYALMASAIILGLFSFFGVRSLMQMRRKIKEGFYWWYFIGGLATVSFIVSVGDFLYYFGEVTSEYLFQAVFLGMLLWSVYVVRKESFTGVV